MARWRVLGLALCLTPCLALWATSTQARDKIGLVVATTGFQYLPPLVAQQMGYFGNEGIEVEIAYVAGAKALAAVISGDAQVYAGVPPSAFRARSKGSDVTVFGATFSQIGSNFVISGDWAKKHGITAASAYPDKLKALKGMAVGVTSAGSGTDQLVRFLAKDAGIRADRDMTITALGTGDAMTAALVQGRIDGFLLSSPVGENAVRNHGAVMFFNTSRGEIEALNGFFYIGQIAQEAWLKKNPDLAVRYLRAIQTALDTLHDPQKTLEARERVYAAYHTKTDKALYDEVWAGTLPGFPKTVEITPGMIEMAVGFMNEFEKDPVDPKTVAAAWTNDYAQKAIASLKRP